MVETEKSKQAAPPKPSASIILLRDGPDGVELFVVQRSEAMDVAANATAFPGGALDQQDIDFANAINPEDHLLAVKINAIRELFEETGLLYASSEPEGHLLSAKQLEAVAHFRQPIIDEQLTFERFLADQGLHLRHDALFHFIKLVTPKVVRRRFSTDFFVAVEPADQRPDHHKDELQSAYWCSLQSLLKESATGSIELRFPTELNCVRLAQQDSVENIMTNLEHPVPVVTPFVEKLDDGILLTAPPEAGVGNMQRLVPLTIES